MLFWWVRGGFGLFLLRSRSIMSRIGVALTMILLRVGRWCGCEGGGSVVKG